MLLNAERNFPLLSGHGQSHRRALVARTGRRRGHPRPGFRDGRPGRGGEMARLITAALRDTRPGIRVQPAGDLKNALGIALDRAGRDEPILLLYEKLQPVADLLQTLDARAHSNPG